MKAVRRSIRANRRAGYPCRLPYGASSLAKFTLIWIKRVRIRTPSRVQPKADPEAAPGTHNREPITFRWSQLINLNGVVDIRFVRQGAGTISSALFGVRVGTVGTCSAHPSHRIPGSSRNRRVGVTHAIRWRRRGPCAEAVEQRLFGRHRRQPFQIGNGRRRSRSRPPPRATKAPPPSATMCRPPSTPSTI
jgi:hypothetical protein